MSKVKLNLIAAACENMGIGTNGTLPWRLKKEMAYFTSMTTKVKEPNMVNAVIMGRRTWDSIPLKFRPLSDRVNIILTHNVDDVKVKGAFYASVRGSLKLRPCRKSRKLPRVSLSATRWMWHPHGESIDTYLRSLTLSNVKSIIVCGSLLSVVTHCGGIRADTVAKVPDGVIVVRRLDEAVSYIDSREDIESTWVIGGSSVYKTAMEHPNCGNIYLTEIQKSFDCDTFFPDIDQQCFHLINEDGVPGGEQAEGDITYFYRVYKKL